MNMSELSPEQLEQRLAQMPGPEDWVALQGGKPIIYFRSPERPTSKGLFTVMHVYGEPFADDMVDLPKHYGMIVYTTYEQMERSIKKPGRFEVNPVDIENGEPMGPRLVLFPGALVVERHGKPCFDLSNRSTSGVNQTEGTFVKSAKEFQDRLHIMKQGKAQEMRLGVAKDGGFLLRPKEIPRALGNLAAS